MGVDISHPIGSTYTQYPMQPNPNDLFGLTTWEVINYGGAFFRAEGGNALAFETSLTISSINNKSITFTTDHGLSVGSLLYDYENNECRTVVSITDTTTVEIDMAFTNNIENVLVGQSYGIPNIKGNFAAGPSQHSNSYIGGAFYHPDNSTANWYSGSSSTKYKFDFDASRLEAGTYNPYIYKDNHNEVTPMNYTYRVWMRTL